MFRWFWAVKRSSQVESCRPGVEGLEGRRLMSATLLDTGSGVGLDAAAHGSGGGAGKVSMQDFHFVMRSLAGQGAGKVSMNDFVLTTLAGQGAGKVSMNDLLASASSGGGAGKVSMND
jgi:hypothetical protein